MAENAKHEFQKELEIDPENAGAEYVLGELARQGTNGMKPSSISREHPSWMRHSEMHIWDWALSLMSVKEIF